MDESIKLKLLKGTSFKIEKNIQVNNENKKEIICEVKPLTLGKIIDIGLDTYNLYLSNMIADVSDYNIPDIDLSQYTYWDILIASMHRGDKSYCETILNAINIFVNNEIQFDKQSKLFFTNEGNVIDKDIFDEIRNILKWQNCLKNNQEKEERYADERSRLLAEKFKMFREKMKPKTNENPTTLKDLISGISARHPSINLLNIWDLTIYQLYDQLGRLNLVDSYNTSIILLPYSEDAGKNMKHWSTILKEDDI